MKQSSRRAEKSPAYRANPIHRILIVDDDPFIVQGLKAFLEDKNIEVLIADSVEDVEILLKSNTFSLLLVDLRLSGVDGKEGLEIIRYCKEKQPDAHVVMMTAYGTDEVRKEAFRLGASEFFEKPINLPGLTGRIRRMGIPVKLAGSARDDLRKERKPATGRNPNLKKILVVEDSPLMQRMYGMVLNKYTATGCKLVQAKDGREGLEKLSENPDVDFIILDINMPVMNGLEFLCAPARRNEFSHVPVVVISTEGKEEDAKRALQEGARDYITKPFKPQRLLDIIAKFSPANAPAAGATRPVEI
jgi:DNA-binding response OmpR family regulator